jgi:hypothetical protein
MNFIARSMSRLNFIQGKLMNLKVGFLGSKLDSCCLEASHGFIDSQPNHRASTKARTDTLSLRRGHAFDASSDERDIAVRMHSFVFIDFLRNVEHQLFLKDIGRLDLLDKLKSRQRRTLISNPIARWTEMPIPFRVMEERGSEFGIKVS